jgi:hypothetical protein
MSRLDSFIRRMQAQRACLDLAAEMIAKVPGPVLELGLGNGRTYDHLRERLPDRRIYVFERLVQAHPSCIPPEEDLFLGDFRETLPTVAGRIGVKAALVHADFGQGDAASIAAMAQFLADSLSQLTAPGAIIVSDQPINGDGWENLPLPDGIKPRRYFMQRVPG